MPLYLIKQTRVLCGDKFALGARISVDEHVEGGLTLNHMKSIVPVLAQSGLDFIEISSGSYAAFKHMMPEKEMVFLPDAEEIKSVIEIHVICANFYKPDLAGEALRKNRVDMISLGRSALADPEWPNKVREGRVEEIVRCRHCGQCSASGMLGLGVRCKSNKQLGLERFQKTSSNVI